LVQKEGAGCRNILPLLLQRASLSADSQVNRERLAPRSRAWGLSLRWFASIEDARSTIDDWHISYTSSGQSSISGHAVILTC
jgi:hypothetical protein